MSGGSNPAPLLAVAVVALAGVVVWRERDRLHDLTSKPGAAPVSGAAPQYINTGSLLPTGSTPAPVGSPAASQSDLEKLAKYQQTQTLQADLSRIVNDMKVELARADAIKAAVIDPAFRSSVIDRVWAECKATYKFFPTVQCEKSGIQVKAEQTAVSEWEAKKANDLKPIQAELSRLNAAQLDTVEKLRQLGVTVPAGSVVKGVL